MLTIRIRTRDAREEDLRPADSDQEILRFFFLLHNAVHVSTDPVPLVYRRADGRAGLLYPQDVAGLRLLADGEDVTHDVLSGS